MLGAVLDTPCFPATSAAVPLRDPGAATACIFSASGTGPAFGFGPLYFLCPGASSSIQSQRHSLLAGQPILRMVLARLFPCVGQQPTAACPISRASLGSRCRFWGLASPCSR